MGVVPIIPEQIQQAANAGFKSGMNLRSPSESGFIGNEEQLAQSSGMEYVNRSVDPAQLTEQLTNRFLTKLRTELSQC